MTRQALLTLTALGLALAMPAFAQDQAAPAAVEEIIVTSTRREERVQDVPIAVTVISADYLELAAPQNLLDATGLSPNLFIGQQTAGPGLSAIYTRGLGYSDIEKTQNPAVGVLVDGVFLGTNTGQLTDLFDVAQIEIDRGPQGLLFGKNTTGGVIDIKRTRPTEDPGVRAQFLYGTFDELAAKAVLNSGRFLDDMLGVKLGVSYREADGFYENLYDGSSLGDVDTLSLHAAVAFDPTEDLSFYLVFDYMDDDGGTPPVQAENGFGLGAFGFPGGLNGLDPHDTLADIDQDTEFDTTRFSLQVEWDTPLGTLTSITGYLDSEDDVVQDFDATCVSDLKGLGCAFPDPNPALGGAPSLHIRRDQQYDRLSQELRLATDWTERIRTIIGAYYFDSSVELTQLTDLGIGFISAQVSEEDSESIALFGQVEVDLTDQLTFSGGLRYISEDKEFESASANFMRLDSLEPGVFLSTSVPFFDDRASFNELITRFSLDYRIDENHLVYLSRAEGFRSGGFSIRATLSETIPGQTNFGSGPFSTYEPEEIATYELGSKNVFLDGGLIVNLAAFYQELDGQQANFVVVTPGFGPQTNTYINNLQETNGWGVELEAWWTTPIEGLSFSGAFGYQDIEIDEADLPAVRVPVGPFGQAGTVAQGVVDFSDLPLSRTPDFNYAITAIYESELPNGMPFGGQVSFRYIDDFVLANMGTTPEEEDAYGLLDLSVYVEVSEHVRLAFFGRNVTDEDYRANALPSVGIQRFARPRTFFGQVTIEY